MNPTPFDLAKDAMIRGYDEMHKYGLGYKQAFIRNLKQVIKELEDDCKDCAEVMQ